MAVSISRASHECALCCAMTTKEWCQLAQHLTWPCVLCVDLQQANTGHVVKCTGRSRTG